MNINATSSASLVQANMDVVSTTVLKKALDIEVQTAMNLINALPQPAQQSSANLPANLGKNINTTA
ncbi:MAG: putative motility protein [Gallionellaceae bacterium]|jgi:hypothetical protein